MDKKQRYMNLAIILVLVVFMTIRAIPKKALELDTAEGLFGTHTVAQLTAHIQPKGRLAVSQFSRNNNDAENFSIDLMAQGDGDRGNLWYVIYDAAEKQPYRAFQQSNQITAKFDELPTLSEAYERLDRLHPLMPELMDTLTGPAVDGVKPFLSLRSNYWWDGAPELTIEKQTVLDKNEGGSTHTVPGEGVTGLTGVRYFTYGDTLTEGSIADAYVDSASFLVYRTDIVENIQSDNLVAIVNAAA